MLFRRFLLILALFGLPTGSGSTRMLHAAEDADSWFPSIAKPTRGVVIVTHGLNNRPEIMDPLIEVLTANGLDVRRVALTLHQQADKQNRERLEELWLGDIASARDDCIKRRPNSPIFAVGYSLGGLVTLSYLDQNPDAFQKLVLFAPAIQFTRGSKLLRPLAAAAAGANISLPSFAPPDLRARNSTPLAEYDAMYRLAGTVDTLKNATDIGKVPTRVFMSPGDELVNYCELGEWIQTNRLVSWELSSVHLSKAAAYQHLIVVPDALGETNWEQLTGQVVDFLTTKEPVREPNGRD